ncbi:hypothetical protein JXA70_09640 [candidate division KSB1 bacterium]|nr:hypothetical protein [candidate division KSB1 bacterium]
MIKLFFQIIVVSLLLVRLSATAEPNSETFVVASSIYARGMAMGGALTAMPDHLENILYNPAAMGLETDFDRKITFYFNPIGGASALLNASELSSRTPKTAYDWLSAVGLFARALTFSTSVFQLSALFSEELLNNPQHLAEDKIVSTRGLLDWNYHAVAARLTLAEQVSLGATGYAFNLINDSGELKRSFGSSYGILMRPSNKISAGVSYYYFPEKADTLLFVQHRISNKSVNMGIVYRPFSSANLAVDFRNVSEEDNNSTNEIHAGLEVILANFLALRGGYFCQPEKNSNIFSLGFGLADFRPFRSVSDRFVFSNIILNYGLQVEQAKRDFFYIHYMTFLIRL